MAGNLFFQRPLRTHQLSVEWWLQTLMTMTIFVYWYARHTSFISSWWAIFHLMKWICANEIEFKVSFHIANPIFQPIPVIYLETFTMRYDGTVEKAMAPHSSTLAWRSPWTEEPGGLQSVGSLRVRQDWETSLSLFPFMHWRREWQPTPVFLPGESQGRGSLVGCRLWGRTESDTTERLSSSRSMMELRSKYRSEMCQ